MARVVIAARLVIPANVGSVFGCLDARIVGVVLDCRSVALNACHQRVELEGEDEVGCARRVVKRFQIPAQVAVAVVVWVLGLEESSAAPVTTVEPGT